MERISAAVTLKKIWKALGRYFSWNPLANMACTILFSRQVLGWENIVCEIYISSSTFSSLRICIHENRKCMVGCVYAFYNESNFRRFPACLYGYTLSGCLASYFLYLVFTSLHKRIQKYETIGEQRASLLYKLTYKCYNPKIRRRSV